MRAARLLMSFVLFASSHCGSRSGPGEGGLLESGPAPPLTEEGTGLVAFPERCVADWDVLYEPAGFLNSTLAMTPERELLFAEVDASTGAAEIRALALAGNRDSTRRITEGLATELWVDGEDVLFWFTNQLYRAPLGGGANVLELDARPSRDPNQGGSIIVEADGSIGLAPQRRGGAPSFGNANARATTRS